MPWYGVIRDRRTSYLHIEVSTDLGPGDFVTVTTVVENRSMMKKKLDNAFLLIGPEREDPRETMYKITDRYFCSTNEIVEHNISNTPSESNERFLIPVDFYYSENVRIADEKMSYRVPIDVRNMKKGIPYSVRFFIGTPGRYHRST